MTASKEKAELPETPETATEEVAAPQPADEGAALLEKIRLLEEEITALKDQRMRALAETDNVRKRASRDQEEISKYAVTGFARDMVSVLENLKRAEDSIHTHKENEDVLKTLAEGVGLTLKELLAIFEKYAIQRLDPMGEKFNPNFHQAVAQVERTDVPPGVVVQVIQAGYVIHDRLLRPAMVAVSKHGEPLKAVDTKV